ncbi:methylcytosine dioxygenase TET2-like [Acipenser oxyrinchus oxyrinchus]|uniref:Methylcytosine dioxygenase TET n=1 Tax=Acipenser oxyrinchus oxyrinchus TaxID=40147 RepID=A0AAD8LUA3_ACIOX|nr:methylcytosine dioxygenase TET2-like [Acipenser oxyrinchus oxyrinchus]
MGCVNSRRKQDGCPLGFVKKETQTVSAGVLQGGGKQKEVRSKGSLVDGSRADQIESDRASHVADKRLSSLLLAYPTNVHQTKNLNTKLQNGNQLPEALQQQINWDNNWNHFKSNLGVNQMKRQQENSSSPAIMQDLIENTPYIQNGGIKHTFSESSLLGLHESKKVCLDLEVNGQESKVAENNVINACSKKEALGIARTQNSFPELRKPLECECDGPECPKLQKQKECNQDKKNCNYYNGDIFSLSRNKQMPLSNGATVSPSSMENIHGDLLEKTLSQYYPDHVSIALQNNASQEHAVKSPVANDLSIEATHSLHTSGLAISPQTSASTHPEVPDTVSPEVHTPNIYNTQVSTDSYLNEFQGETQLPQQQQSYNLQTVPVTTEQCNEGQVPGKVQPARPRSSLQGQTNTECFSNESETPETFHKPNAGLSVETHSGEVDRFNPFENITETDLERIIKNEESKTGHRSQAPNLFLQPQNLQHRVSYATQQQLRDYNAAEISGILGSPISPALPNQLPPPQLIRDPPISANDLKPQPPYQQGQKALQHLTSQQKQGSETENEMPFNGEAGEILQQTHSHPPLNWIDLNSSQPSQQGVLSQTWKNLNLLSQQHKQMQSQGETHTQNTEAVQGFQIQGFQQSKQQEQQMPQMYKPGLAQDQMQQAAEWQQQNSKTSPVVQAETHMQPNILHHGNQQYNLSQQQIQHQFQPQQQHLYDNTQDIQQMLSSEFLHDQQPHQPQSEQQQVQHVFQQHSSQDTKGVKMGPPQEPPQRPFDRHLLNRMKLEEYIRLEKQLKTSNYKSHQIQTETCATSPSKAVDPYLESTLPNTQPPQNNSVRSSYEKADGSIPQEQYKFHKMKDMQQAKYSPSPGAPKQYLQQQQILEHGQQLNHMGIPPPPQQQQLQPGQSSLNQQVMGHIHSQIYTKSESREPCAKTQPEQLPSQNHREVHKHAALRWHLLKKQEQAAYHQNLEEFKTILKSIKSEHNPQPEPFVPLQAREMGNAMMGNPIKQEFLPSNCEQKSIIATMEQQLKQYQLSPLFEKKDMIIKSPKQVKVETAGAVTVLSTNIDLGGEDKRMSSDFTPTKRTTDHNLNNFLESPLKLLDTPIKNLLGTPIKTQYDFPSCHCVEQLSEKDEGPYYTHLGAAPNVAAIREIMETRFGESGKAIRIEKVVYTGKEGKSTQGCPIAKWVIRRSGVEEKVLVLVRERAGHRCETATIVILILLWDGISTTLADSLYTELSETLRKHGALTNRRCAINEERTCACQGLDSEACGASFSFGCSWSMYYNGCKFARSKVPRKFKLLGDDPKEEERLEQNLQSLATLMAPAYKQMAPESYGNQIEHEHRAPDCRLGLKEGRPFSGVTACLDFCAHSHRDLHNMQSGSTLVCTLTREDNREIGKLPEDEQLHVLPLYKVSQTDEFGSFEAQQEKIKTGAIQVLNSFRRKVRMLAEPAKTCRQRKLEAKRASAAKPSNQDTPSKADKANQVRLKQSTYDNTAQSTPVSGPHAAQGHIGAARAGVQQHSLSNHQQKNPPNHYPSSLHPSNYPTFPNPANPYPSTSQPAGSYPVSSAPGNPYSSSLRVANSYLNGSNPTNPYPGPLNRSNHYPGYQCNGNMLMDNYHHFMGSYGSNPQHMDAIRHQSSEALNKLGLSQVPSLYSQQQYGSHQGYGISYPPRYGDHNMQVNGYSNCNIRPTVHHMGPYSSFGPNHQVDPHFIEAIPRTPSSHSGLDFPAVSKGNQYPGYPNRYLVQRQNSAMFNIPPDSFHMQNKNEMNLHSSNGISRMLPSMINEPSNPSQPAYGLTDGNIQGNPAQPAAAPAQNAKEVNEEVWSDSEHNFLDPEIGGVAVAPSHGSILIECAKRELHATTPLKNPNRNHPTRISLVFYQHKSMNEAKHGLAMWEAKVAEKAREKEEESEKQGSDNVPTKHNGKKVKREHSETSEHSEPPYKRFIQTLSQKSMSLTTDSMVTASPYAFTRVTGPYNRFF